MAYSDWFFSPRGYYFATGGADKMGMVWSTDRLQPLRIFAGHFSDVNVKMKGLSKAGGRIIMSLIAGRGSVFGLLSNLIGQFSTKDAICIYANL